MSFIYFLSKFSQEALVAELFLIACISTCYFGYILIKRRRWGVAKNNIPDNVVRAYLMEMISHAEGFKNQLFGENFKISAGPGFKMPESITTSPTPAQAAAAPSGNSADTSALQAQLSAALAKQQELSQSVTKLNADKAGLEAKLAATPTPAAAAPAGGADKDTLEKISKLEAKLAEYEVIEDDLANLKKYQQENKQLRAQIGALQNGQTAASGASVTPSAPEAPAAAVTVTPEPVAPVTKPAAEEAAPVVAQAASPAPEVVATPAVPETSAIAAAEETVTNAQAEQNFEGLVDKVEESISTPQVAAPPTGATVKDIAASAAPAPTAPEATPAIAAAPEAPPSDKSDADLLSEFERMLNS